MNDLPSPGSAYYWGLRRRALLSLASEGDADSIGEVLDGFRLHVERNRPPEPDVQKFVADFIARLLAGESSRAILKQNRKGRKRAENEALIVDLFGLSGGFQGTDEEAKGIAERIAELPSVTRGDRTIKRYAEREKKRNKALRERMHRLMAIDKLNDELKAASAPDK